MGRATKRLRGQEDSQIVGKAVALAIGVGIGVGIGLLIAPAGGEQTRADIAEKITDFSDKIRENLEKKPLSATGHSRREAERGPLVILRPDLRSVRQYPVDDLYPYSVFDAFGHLSRRGKLTLRGDI